MPAVSAKMIRRSIEKSDRERGCRQLHSQTRVSAPKSYKDTPERERDCRQQSKESLARSTQGTTHVLAREVPTHRTPAKLIKLPYVRTESTASSQKVCRKHILRDLSAIMEESCPDAGIQTSPLNLVIMFCKIWRRSFGMGYV